jgi:hypothetical protein
MSKLNHDISNVIKNYESQLDKKFENEYVELNNKYKSLISNGLAKKREPILPDILQVMPTECYAYNK